MIGSAEMTGAKGLRPDGKPMRALRALEGSDEANPLTEGDVWRRAHNIGSEDSSVWYGALRTLVERGLAQRTGRRGGYQWYITPLGKAAL